MTEYGLSVSFDDGTPTFIFDELIAKLAVIAVNSALLPDTITFFQVAMC